MRSSSMDNSCDNKAYWAFAGGRRFHLLSRHFDMNAFYVFSMKSHDLFPFRSAVRTAAFVIEATGISIYRTTTKKKLRCRESSINLLLAFFPFHHLCWYAEFMTVQCMTKCQIISYPEHFGWFCTFSRPPPPPPPSAFPVILTVSHWVDAFFRASARACVYLCVCLQKKNIYMCANDPCLCGQC